MNKKPKSLFLSEDKISSIISNRLEINKYFHYVYDFSLPNEHVNDLNNTYDGSHYYKFFLDELINFMENSDPKFGVLISDENYADDFKNSLKKYLN